MLFLQIEPFLIMFLNIYNNAKNYPMKHFPCFYTTKRGLDGNELNDKMNGLGALSPAGWQNKQSREEFVVVDVL